jgi:hypothetical protein
VVTDPRAWSGEEGDVVFSHLHREVLCTILTALVVTTRGPAIRAESPAQADSVRRVRSGDPAIAGLIERGASQSATFKQVVAAVGASNGIVYVEPGMCRHGAMRACLRMAMQVSGPNRLLSVVVDKQRAWSDVELIGSIGHELQHAIEALSDPSVTDGAKLYNFFRRYAPTDGNRFETTAAVNIGNSIRDELRRP